MASTPPKDKMASSRLDAIWKDHIEQYRKIDDLEKRIDEHAMRLRRRVTNLCESAPSHRLSHLRLFVSHQERSPESERLVAAHTIVQDNRKKKWTLTIEGKLLIGHLDHESATAFDERLKQAFQKRHSVSADHSSMALATSENFSQTNPTEEEEPIPPIQFTHFFDKMVVQFQTLFQPVDTSTTTTAAATTTPQDTTTPSKSSTSSATTKGGGSSSKKKSRSAKRQKTAAAAAAEAEELSAMDQQNLTFSDPTEFIWNKAITTITNATPGDGRTPGKPAGITTTVTTKDAHAFMVHYDSPAPPAEGMKLFGAIATVQLYPSRGPEQRYKPSKDFAKAFFPKHYSDVTPPTLPTTSIAEAKRADQEKNDTAESNNNNNNTPPKKRGAGPTIPAHQQGPNALENEIHVPTSLTMDEILVALYTYITDHRLTGAAGAAAAGGSVLETDPPAVDDPTLIHNDAKLKALLHCDTMHFNDLPSILTRQKLILLLPKPAPIVVKYILRPSPPKMESTGDNKSTSGTDEEPEDAFTAPMTMDLHNDVYVPNLFPHRARECLRRIKRRETDYTSSRTKARYILIASRAKDEAVLKQKIEEAICGTSIGEWDVLTCLAKAAPPHSEARVTAQLDAKIAHLLDEVEKSQRAAQDAWELVDWCRGEAPAADDGDDDVETSTATATANDKVMRVNSEQEEIGTKEPDGNEETTIQETDAMDVDPSPQVHDTAVEDEPETTI